MSNEKHNCKKIPALSPESLSLLTSLDSVFKRNDVDKRSNVFNLNQEYCSHNNQIKWLIDKTSLDKKEMCGQYIESPAIKCSLPCIRRLLLYPNGKRTGYQSFVSLNIVFRYLTKNMNLHCVVSVLGKDENILVSKEFFGDTNDFTAINFDDFFRKSCLRSYLVNNKLIIRCRIKCILQVHKCVSDKITYQAKEIPESNDFMELIRCGKYSDVILELKSKKIKSHKFILASESPALTVLLRSSGENNVDLSDQKTTIFEDLRSFIYTGNIQILNFNHVCELYITADEFGVLNLRDVCSVFLSSSLTESNVPYLLELSTDYKDQHLIDSCLKFLKVHDIKSESFIKKIPAKNK